MKDRIALVLYAIAVALGAATLALSFLGTRSTTLAMLLGVGLFAVGLGGMRSLQR